ncbi:MAG: DUF5615 family PIN-like protein [Nostoc sp. ChiSLP02]|nr:DUF5615 family PIN-like protein [Nostoc sp. DedSLP05]MDZ8098071.1 DUF5615 family PIN-like protein [Nostoc sp. DedSLP01]MDZ8189323.1 DUF5615 family PIN-like protein [Nostoc sp. ChiSLP02]
MTIQYLIDENVNPLYAQQLRRRELDILVEVVGEPGTPLKGTLDPEILIWCETYQAILVTNNRKSMPVHLRDRLAQNPHVPGIFILNASLGIGETIDELILIAKGSFDNEYQDRISFLPIP